jgi:hypothetical protein
MPRATISACLIVQDERERLPAALASVAFCDEVIVVDGGSGDGTVELARAAGAKVIERPWRGFAIQRNVAIDAARGDWVLEVDADERVSPALRASIEDLLARPPATTGIAVCALRNRFLGGTLGPSAKYPAYRSRLFRRDAYRHDESLKVHEGLEIREPPAILSGDLEHELATTLREALLDTWSYARLESRQIARPRSARAYLMGIALRPATKLAYRTAIDGGWRDGWRGLLKISLDTGSDALVWTLVLLGHGRSAEPVEGAGVEHFGRRRAGPARILAVAARGEPTRQAERWLGGLRQLGADVALVSEEPDGTGGIPCQTVPRIGPLAVIRALEVERQVRLLDAVVPFGGRARLTQRLLPRTLRPEIAGLSPATDPDRAFALIEAAVGPPS